MLTVTDHYGQPYTISTAGTGDTDQLAADFEHFAKTQLIAPYSTYSNKLFAFVETLDSYKVDCYIDGDHYEYFPNA